jgi:hypothetical protein
MESGAGAVPFRTPSWSPRALLRPLPWVAAAVAPAAALGYVAAADRQLCVALIVGIIGTALVLRWPFIAWIAVLVVATRHSPFAELVMLVGGGVYALLNARRLRALVLLIPFGAFMLFALTGVVWDGPYRNYNIGLTLNVPVVHEPYLDNPTIPGLEWLRLVFVFVMASVATLVVRDPRRFRLAILAVLAGSAWPLVDGMLQLVQGDLVVKDKFEAVRGPFDFPNEFGFYLVLILALATVAWFEFRDERWGRAGSGLVAGVGLLMLLHTYTRSAWLGFATVLLLVAVFEYQRLVWVGVIVFLLAALASPSAVESVQRRFGDITSQNEANAANSLTWRKGQWRRMRHFGSEKPFTGQGFGRYRELTIKQFGFQDATYKTISDPQQAGALVPGFTAHNDYMKMFVETGVPGLALWIAVLLGMVAAALRAARSPEVRPWAIALAAVALAFIGMSAGDNIQNYTVPLVLLVSLIAAANAASMSSASRPSS